MKGEAVTTPLEELAQYVGPNGRGVARRILDIKAPFFKALWTERQGIWSHLDCKRMGNCQNLFADGSSAPGTTDCGGTGYVPRSHAEAILRLWAAVFAVWPDAYMEMRRGVIWLRLHYYLELGEEYHAVGEEALAAVVLAALKEEEKEKP